MADSSINNTDVSAEERPSDGGGRADTLITRPLPETPQIGEAQVDPGTDSQPGTSQIGEAQVSSDTDLPRVESEKKQAASNPRRESWYQALKDTFPIYLVVHIGFIVTTIYATLFVLHDFQYTSLPLSTLWNSWHRWDTGHYLLITRDGYTSLKETAFFPLFPILVRLVSIVLRDPFISGLVVANVMGLGFLIVFYRLVKEEFDSKLAQRTILYISIFPTAFFFSTMYTETTFLFFALLAFYYLRKGNWWLAGLFGLLTSLTRSTGLLLALPFYYEYLAQHGFTFKTFPLKNLRLNFLAGILIPLGTGLFMFYCYLRFQDPLAFSHAEIHWTRSLHAPWFGMTVTISKMIKQPHLTFVTLRNLLDLGPDLLMLGLIILMFVGPWRFPIKDWSYVIYTVILYIFFLIEPVYPSIFPLQSTNRYVLALFPAFIILARMGKNRAFHVHYLLISGAFLFFLLTQFLTHHWIV